MFVSKLFSNPWWFFEKAQLALRSKSVMKKDDIVLAMFPKTGSTWIRFFLFNILNEVENKGLDSNIDRMNQTMPEFGHKSMFSPWPFDMVPRLVKTHRPANVLTRGYRTVLVIRDPRDVAVSYYHYANAKKELEYSGELLDIINHPQMGFEYFFRQFNSWKDDAGLILKYEDLKNEPQEHFRRLSNFIGVQATDVQITNAIAKSDLNSMRKAQELSTEFKGKFDKGFVFARKGESDQWRSLFGAKELDIWEKLRRDNGFSLYQ